MLLGDSGLCASFDVWFLVVNVCVILTVRPRLTGLWRAIRLQDIVNTLILFDGALAGHQTARYTVESVVNIDIV